MTQVHLSAQASRDLQQLKQYIQYNLNSPKAATKITGKILKSIRQLERYPALGAPLATIVDFETDYRFLVSQGYLTFYQYKDNAVYISRIVHAKQNFVQVLFGDVLQPKQEHDSQER